jgi:glycosyltransferase involved in cell wall biosynthesis
MPLCEIRIPTYRRPALLRRCLSHLERQTEQDFVCVVFDDSPDREAEDVLADFPTLAIDYRPNPSNLGISRNLGQCFCTKPFNDAEYAFCCEDDNYVLPNFIRDNIMVCLAQKVNIVVRDQAIETTFGEICPTYTNMWGCFPEGRHEPLTALLTLFPCGGIGNASLFWSTKAKTELGIGLDCADPKLVEYMRPFTINEPWAFAAQPALVWHGDPVSSFRLSSERRRQLTKKAWRQVAIARLRREAIRRLELAGLWPAILEMLSPNVWERVEWTTAWAGRPVSRGSLRRWSVLKRYLMGLAIAGVHGPKLGTFEQGLGAPATC